MRNLWCERGEHTWMMHGPGRAPMHCPEHALRVRTAASRADEVAHRRWKAAGSPPPRVANTCRCERPWRDGDECSKCGRPITAPTLATIPVDSMGRRNTARLR